MMKYNPAMLIDEYTIPDTASSSGQLLLQENGEPDRRWDNTSYKTLAEFASLIHSKSEFMSHEDTESVIMWLKKWKLRSLPLTRKSSIRMNTSFDDVLDSIRNSSEQKKLEREAYLLTLWSRLWGICFGIAVIVTLLVFATDLPKYWFLVGSVLGFIFFHMSDSYLVDAIKLYKEQEQRNLWAAIREAETVEELAEAGLFAYLSKIPNRAMSDEEFAAIRKEQLDYMKAEQIRLTDALYTDPEALILN